MAPIKKRFRGLQPFALRAEKESIILLRKKKCVPIFFVLNSMGIKKVLGPQNNT